jgi:beta-hydroxylase
MSAFLTLKYALFALFAASVVYVHCRGRVRHRLFRQLGDHSTFMAPYNTLVYLFSTLPDRPYTRVDAFPDLLKLRADWEMIREEGLQLLNQEMIRAAQGYNDIGFNSFFRTGWKRFYLKWYDDFLPSARELCPKTVELLGRLPTVNAAMFAVLPPGARLVRHRDPFAGSLRYHLGLSTPNSPDCYIVVDGDTYYYRDGHDMVFDETYIHYAENKTDTTRLILFCDVERPFTNPVMRALNRFMARHVMRASETQNVDGEKIGVLNRLFALVYPIRIWSKKLKAWNRTAYYVWKWFFFGTLAYLIFVR